MLHAIFFQDYFQKYTATDVSDLVKERVGIDMMLFYEETPSEHPHSQVLGAHKAKALKGKRIARAPHSRDQAVKIYAEQLMSTHAQQSFGQTTPVNAAEHDVVMAETVEDIVMADPVDSDVVMADVVEASPSPSPSTLRKRNREIYEAEESDVHEKSSDEGRRVKRARVSPQSELERTQAINDGTLRNIAYGVRERFLTNKHLKKDIQAYNSIFKKYRHYTQDDITPHEMLEEKVNDYLKIYDGEF